MLKRLHIYLKEMFPLPTRIMVSAVLFSIMYLRIIVVGKVLELDIGPEEFIAVLTIFAALLSLRIIDEFKDFDTDKLNFPERPLPSGRVRQSDLVVLLVSFQIPTIVLNVFFMNNLWWFVGLWGYGTLMSFWFFSKKLIKPNLFLALLTHNPVLLLLNFYITSFICTKYALDMFAPENLIIAFALYVPAIVYEIGRKIRAPHKETAYTTYSKLMGYKRAVLLVVIVILISTMISTYLLMGISIIAIVLVWLLLASIIIRSCLFVKNPDRKPYFNIVASYLFGEQVILLAGMLWAVILMRV